MSTASPSPPRDTGAGSSPREAEAIEPAQPAPTRTSDSPGAVTGTDGAAGGAVAGGGDNLLPGDHWTQQAIDPRAEDEDQDSAFGDNDQASSTASLTSSILKYRTLHGRTYHSERGNAAYWGANDDAQNVSMDLNHHTLTMAIGDKLYLSPLKDDIKKAVDIGTGTGLWAIDFADTHPDCEVIGTDISPIQPSWVPPNLRFEIDDCTQDWLFGSDTLDFVHMRYLTGSIVDWHAMFKEAFRCCKSGGWLESLEAEPYMDSDDGTVLKSSAMGQWGQLFVKASELIPGPKRSFTIVNDDVGRTAMADAGFVDIREYNVKVPLGEWAKDPRQKELGRFSRITLEQDIEGYVLYVANIQGWSKENVTVYAANMRRELRNKDIHGFFRVRVTYGRKP